MTRNSITMRSLSSRMLAAIACVVLFGVLVASATQAVTADESVITSSDLNEQLADVDVQPYLYTQGKKGATTRVKIESNDRDYTVHKRTLVGLAPLSLFGDDVPRDVVEFSDRADEDTLITVEIEQDGEVVETMKPINTGTWVAVLEVDSLEEGEYVAYVQAEHDSVMSQRRAVAQFTVLAQESVSNTTWITLIIGGTVLILILLGVNAQLYFSRRQMDAYQPVTAAIDDPDTHVQAGEEMIQSVSAQDEEE